MQRRKFLRTTGLAGAAALATLHLPALARVHLSADTRLRTSLLSIGTGERLAAAPARYRGPVQVRVTGVETDQAGRRVDLCAWFSTDQGPSAFDFASTGSQGQSASLRFRVDAERLLGFAATVAATVAGAEACADCPAADAAGGRLAPGDYWLLVHGTALAPTRPDQAGVVARIRLEVSALATSFDGLRTPSFDGLRTPSFDGLRTPSFDGLRTPSFDGLRTPSFDGLRTPSFDGLRTPSFDGLRTE